MNMGAYIIPCYLCEDRFQTELNMRAHAMYKHGKFISECSTGVAERLYREHMNVIKRRKESMSTYICRRKLWKEKRGISGNTMLGHYKKWLKYVARGFKPYNRRRKYD